MSAPARPPTRTPQTTTWTIDADDVITGVGGDWDEFAGANGAAALCGTRVVGAPLFDFITGQETQRIYRLLLHKVRSADAVLRVPFRCDSPEVRRHMRLEIAPMSADAIEFRGEFLGGESRPRVRLLDPNEARSRTLLVSCSFCLRLRVPPDEWIEPEHVVARMDLLSGVAVPQLIHGVCPECSASLRERLGAKGDAPGT